MTTDTVETNAVHHPVVSGARWTTEPGGCWRARRS